MEFWSDNRFSFYRRLDFFELYFVLKNDCPKKTSREGGENWEQKKLQEVGIDTSKKNHLFNK